MSVFDEEDTKTVKRIGWTGVGFISLTVLMAVLAAYVTG